MLDGKLSIRPGVDTPPDTPNFANGADMDIYNLVHEDEREQGLLVLIPTAHYFFTFSHHAHSMRRLVYRYMETDCHYREQARPHCLCL